MAESNQATCMTFGDGAKVNFSGCTLQVQAASKGPNQKEEDVARGVERMNLRETDSDISQTRHDVREPTNMRLDEAKHEHSAQRMKADMLSDRARLLISNSDYEGATSLLEDPCVLESDYFLPKLMLAECYLYLGKHRNGLKMIDEIRKTIMTSSELKVDDVVEYANDFIDHSFHIRAIILLRIGSDMFKTNASTPDDVVDGIYWCLDKTDDATEAMIEAGGRSLAIGVEYGIEYMKEILDDLRSVKNANPENKALIEAESCDHIGSILSLADEYENCIKYLQTGVEILDQQFGSKASKYKIYGNLLNNLGTAHCDLGENSEAEPYYVKAIKAYKKATDFSDKSEKQKVIKQSKNDLKDTRAEAANEVDSDADSTYAYDASDAYASDAYAFDAYAD